MALFSIISIMKSSYRHPCCHSWLFTKTRSEHFLRVKYPAKQNGRYPLVTLTWHSSPPTIHWTIVTWCLLQWYPVALGTWVSWLASVKWLMEGGFHGRNRREKILFPRELPLWKPLRISWDSFGDILQRGWWPWGLTAIVQGTLHKSFVCF